MGAIENRNRYRAIADKARKIPYDHGLRNDRVYLIGGSWTGLYTGEGVETQTSTELTVYGGVPPKVRQLNSEQLALGNLPLGSLKVGPITPPYPGGGFDLTALGAALTTGQTFEIKVVRQSGEFTYVLDSIEQDHALHYMLVLKPLGKTSA